MRGIPKAGTFGIGLINGNMMYDESNALSSPVSVLTHKIKDNL
jgi:hypothetical protein